MAENISGFLVVGVSEAVAYAEGGNSSSEAGAIPSQTSIVGVATDLDAAKDIIGKDYLETLGRVGKTPITMQLTGPYVANDNSVSYAIVGYTWHAIPLQFNTVVNFTL